MPDVDFRGYSGDCLIQGTLDVPDGMRLTDFMNDADEIVVRAATLRALSDGHVVSAGDQTISVEELWAIEPTDPPTAGDLRVSTRSTEVSIDLDPYSVNGFLHAVSAGDPLAALHRRKRMVPMTDAVITFAYEGNERRHEAGVLIFNREMAKSVERVMYQRGAIDDIGVGPVDERARDLTGQIRTEPPAPEG
jgi:hypothetical protein